MTPSKDASSMSVQSDASTIESHNGMMDDASSSSFSLNSPPRSGRKSRLSARIRAKTHESRRLFNFDDEDNGDSDHSSVHQSPTVRRFTLKPLDLNNDMENEKGAANNDNNNNADTALYGGRKRPSSEHRGDLLRPPRTPNGGRSGCPSDQTMFASPHISPNSFRTMDGRFVHSKNPFSSPMMTDEEQQQQFHPSTTVAEGSNNSVPSFPVSFPLAGDSKISSILPPRQQRLHKTNHETVLTADKNAPAGEEIVQSNRDALYRVINNTGFPDKRYCFTGSPIQESHAMETDDTASSGSFHKVRRLNKTNDIVTASGQQLSSRRKQLAIDTSAANHNTMPSVTEEISPTDVTAFPPPTPVKPRPNSHSPYNSIRRHEPSTPSTNRRCPSAKTPHPGPMFHRRNIRDQDEKPEGPKSRFYGDFDVIGELGKGGFGAVHKVLSRLDGCMYAIKVAHRSAKGTGDRERMLREVSTVVIYFVGRFFYYSSFRLWQPYIETDLIFLLRVQKVYALAALSDQADTATLHIVRYHQAWMEDDRLYIQTELCSGTLADEIVSQGLLAERRRYKLIREILLALEFIHRNNMVHLDIKPENIFIKNDQYKLGDFGLVSKASCSEEVEEGDSRYMSMELLSGRPSDLTKSDIFSLGATLYEICLRQPLPMNGQEWQDIRAGKLSPLADTPAEMTSLIHAMMSSVANFRPTANELLKRPELLSDEQKALNAEKFKVAQANMELHAQAQRFSQFPPKRGMTKLSRSSSLPTWSGGFNL